MKKVLKKIFLFVALVMSVTLITGCTSETENGTEKSKKDIYTLGETFKFDDLEITLGDELTFDKNTNEYSDYYNKDVIKIPVTVKNLKEETNSLNMFYYKAYGSQGTEIGSQSAYFEDSVDFAGELRTGASYTKYFYFEYDGDGKYAIEFDNWTEKVTVEFDVTK